jgi:hypothetical protein
MLCPGKSRLSLALCISREGSDVRRFTLHPCKSVMTQIQDLSSEIICEIFKNFSTPVSIHPGPTSEFPWFLGQICARWRIVFLSMSTHFWGDIKINVCKATKPFPLSVAYFERALDILNFCLKCNEGCPLSFSFWMGAHYTEEYLYAIDILDALLAQSTRWVKVDLCIQAAEVAGLHCIKGRTPLLQSLRFALMELEDWDDLSMPIDREYARFVDAFEDSPRLTHLELYMSNIKGWKCDWSSMVVLRLKSLSTADGLVAALSQSMRLEELEVTWPNGYADSISEPIDIALSIITLLSLKTMTIPWNVLGVLTAPGLEHLSIEFSNRDEHVGIVTAFLRRSACPLGHLVLKFASPAVAVEVLSVIPGLPSLEIRHYHNVDGIIKVFNCNLPEGALLIGPRLKSLQIHLQGDLKQGEVAELSAMVASRGRNVKVDVLQELTLWADYSWMTIDLAVLQSQCEEQGVKLTVGGGLSLMTRI